MDEEIKVRFLGDASGLNAASTISAKGLENVTNSAKKTSQGLTQVSQSIAQSSAQMARSAATAGGAVQKSTKDFTGLSRVIQDLPYGFNAISNNLTQLLPAAGAAGLAFSALVSALTLAQIGFGAWTRGIGDSSKELENNVEKINKAKKALEDYITSLDDVTQARLRGKQSAQEDIVQLQTLYAATQNANIPLADRKKLVDEIQDQYPKYFGNIKDEIILAGGAKTAYDELTTAIMASARARAAQDALVDIQKELLVVDQQYAKSVAETTKANQKFQKERTEAARQSAKYTAEENKNSLGFVTNIAALGSAQSDLNNKQKIQNDLSEKRNVLLEKAKQLTGSIKRTTEENPQALLDFKGKLPEIKTPKIKVEKQDTEFLFDFLPFNPSGKLKPEQRAKVLDAMDKFSKEFEGILKGVDFTRQAKTQDEKIKIGLRFDADLKAGKVQLDTAGLISSIEKSLKPEDLVPKDKLSELPKLVVDQFIRGMQDATEAIKNLNPFNLPLNFNLTTDLPAQIDLFKTRVKQIGGKIPEIIEGIDIHGKPVELTLDDLIDTSKIANSDALKALQEAFDKVKGVVKSNTVDFNEALRALVESTQENLAINLGEGIADAINGEGIQKAFAGVANIMGDFLQQLGKLLIKSGIVVQSFKKAFASLLANPVAAVAVGIGLVALGGILKNSVLPKPKGFAKGGLVPGQGTGDTVPAMLTPGEYVVPKIQVPEFLLWLKEKGKTISIPKITNGIVTAATGGIIPATVNRNSNFATGPQTVQVPYFLGLDVSHDKFRVLAQRANKYGNTFGR